MKPGQVICCNVMVSDGVCQKCKHSKPHYPDDTCGVDCPYEFNPPSKCKEFKNPAVCPNGHVCSDMLCYHRLVHEQDAIFCFGGCKEFDDVSGCVELS